jgi:Cdc6-like AAA superfamily ATPase
MTQAQNTQINLGTIKNTSKDLVTKLSDLSFCMVIGGSTSGKTFWLNNIYKQLEEQMSPEELGYVTLNATSAEETLNESYTVARGINTVDENGNVFIALLAEYAELARQRANGDELKNQHIVVHIEGGDLALSDKRDNYLSLVTLLAQNAKQANMSLIIVNSRANELETPAETVKLCSLVAVFAGGNYTPNSRYLKLQLEELREFEKQIIYNNKTYIVDKNLK